MEEGGKIGKEGGRSGIVQIEVRLGCLARIKAYTYGDATVSTNDWDGNGGCQREITEDLGHER